MQYSNIFVIIFFVSSFLNFLLEMILEFVDFSFRKKHGMEIPDEVKGLIDESTLKKTCAYENVKYKFWIPRFVLMFALELYLIIAGFYPAVFETVCTWSGNSIVVNLLYIFFTSIPTAILSIPFNLYSTFGIEKQFGFCKQTFRMWIVDSIKSILVTFVIALPLLAIACALFKHCPNLWWLFLGATYVVFSLAISVIYPILIAPIFNKFTPLEEGELKTRLESLLQRCGFKSSGLFVMDASKRSGHSNAYFTGFGKSKRVVLYDTLIAQLTPEEIEAVLGHELGHYKHHHIVKRMCIMIPLIFAVLFAESIFIKMPELYEGFGFQILTNENGDVSYKMMMVGTIFSATIFGGLAPLASLITNHMSRRDEFQADAFSAKVCKKGAPLISALIKLNKENLSEIQVAKVYSAFKYSHPPLLERIEAIKETEK
ncbi:MAG: M48 family metallopeptidase [Treponema sp.]|nr:M48 family metallopeptidase [Treponema sp.]